ncbi:type II toxin-antitoxin system HicB family antitoxin [Anabaena cylindrica UHCC 0172]|uniref:type II toxin-antitoxin system HicB family antitoxin n=1 Tax=Anabaena cylindrica TaxID=1165 RepID=UPI002B202874|nr:type II toxin-antitoxin system HicB family antitoxin [Anabaena cylindrica]MEA5550822.1 type II toxin-antitoxin system HicB family antitoxin [Anabaena cylindrica UHCC 0172]
MSVFKDGVRSLKKSYNLWNTLNSCLMLTTYTAKYTKINSGYMGQLIEWQEVITEGETLEECRAMLQDAIKEMILAYRQQNKEIPTGNSLLEQIPVEV